MSRIIPVKRLGAELSPTNNIIQTTFVYKPGAIAEYNIYSDWYLIPLYYLLK